MNYNNIKLLIIKELKHYFNTPPLYVLTTVFLLLIGYFFAQPMFLIAQANLNSIVDIMPLILTFFIPALTMKLIAEEKKTQTIEILLTLPFSEEEIIISKYISSVIVMFLAFLLMSFYAITIIMLSKPDIGHIIGTYLGLFLLSISFIAIGIFSSTLSSSQINAFIIGFAISFFFYISGKTTFFLPIYLQNIFNYLGTDIHISNISRGVIDLKDLIYFFSIISAFLYLSVYRLKTMRIK
ncbi:MAG: ABC transporter permease [Elusimicrobiota bacterium]